MPVSTGSPGVRSPVDARASSASNDRSARQARAPVAVTMIGPLPPWRAVAPTTHHLTQALDACEDVGLELLDFSALYPPGLYPGGSPVDAAATPPRFRRARVRRLLAWWNPLSWLWAGLTLRGRVVHAQWWSFILAPMFVTVLALARLRGRRVVITLHNIRPHEQHGWRSRLNALVLPLAHHFIVHARRNAEDLVATYPAAAGRVSIIPLGLLSLPQSRRLAKEEARRALDLPATGEVVLAFGNIRPYKGIDVLLRAHRALLDSGVRATLVIAGQPWGSFDPYRRLIDELDIGPDVRTWLEYLPKETVAAVFAAADLAVFPYSHFDAQSAAAALALSFELPIIVSDAGGLPELAHADAVVPPRDPEALARVMRRALSDGAFRAALTADARRKAQQLDWAAIAAQTAELYREQSGLACASQVAA